MFQVTILVTLRLSSIYAFWMRSGRCQHNDLLLLDIYFSHFDLIDDVSQHDMHLCFPRYILNLVGDAYIYFYLCSAQCTDTHICEDIFRSVLSLLII